MGVNNFLPFCPVDTGTNLDTQSDYAAASDRTDGNQPGVAKSKLVNKALRQASYVVGQLAQLVGDTTGTDVLDDATPAKFYAQLQAALSFLPVTASNYGGASGTSGTHLPTYYFFILAGSATSGATYTNNSITFTVVTTVASGIVVKMKGAGAPLATGTLTKTGGTGDTTLSFYAVRAPLYMEVEMVGGGGGGVGSQGGAGSSGGVGGNGNDTTFGTSLLVAGGGVGGSVTIRGGTGGTGNLNGVVGIVVVGGSGSGAPINGGGSGNGAGGNSAFGGGGGGTGSSGTGQSGSDGATNSGGGGSGAAGATTSAGGGGSGAFVTATLFGPFTSYAYAAGAGGAGGTPGTTGAGGGAGGSGHISVVEYYQ